MATVAITVAFGSSTVQWHARGCQAASRKAVELSDREMPSADLARFIRECEAESRALGEAGTLFHGCLKKSLKAAH